MVFINAISYHFPETFHTNSQVIDEYYKYGGDFSPKITSADIYNQCGINKRYISHPDDTAKDLGNRAAEKLFNEWEIDRKAVEYIIFVSDALDYKGPTTACIMQHDLGLENSVAAIDILHGCTGWVYGISLAKALISSGQVSNVLLITADVPTKIIHPIDIELKSIFSDAGAATFISNKKDINDLNASIGDFVFGTDGKGENTLKVERSATKEPADIEWLSKYIDLPTGLVGGRMIMNSPKVFLFALRKVPVLIDAILKKENLTRDDIDLFILHQANGKMLDFIRKRMKIPQEKFIINIDEIGNTVSASIPLAVYSTLKDSKIKKGSKVLVAGFGIGLSWGATVITF